MTSHGSDKRQLCGVPMVFFLSRQIRTIAIIAEGIPEALTRKLIKTADKKGVTIIGPATVSIDGHLLLSFLTFRSAFSDG